MPSPATDVTHARPLDIDHFESINDEHGHATGDEAPRQFATLLADESREPDLAARIGGEEFTLPLPSTRAHGASGVVERVRERWAATTIEINGCACPLSPGLASRGRAHRYRHAAIDRGTAMSIGQAICRKGVAARHRSRWVSTAVTVGNQKELSMRTYGAEFVGTFWLVLGGCGSAVLAAAFPDVGIGLLGVSLAFGLTVLTMAYAIGHISGCHLNPAVSVGLWAGGRFPANQLVPYIVAQVLGAIAAGGVLYLIASGKAGFDVSAGFASNGYGSHSPGGYSLLAALVTEVVMTAMFLLIILGATDERAPKGFAPLAIGLGLTLIHLISIPVTNTSVNPARSTGVGVFVGGWAVSQLWLFWVAPIAGGILGAIVYRFVGKAQD